MGQLSIFLSKYSHTTVSLTAGCHMKSVMWMVLWNVHHGGPAHTSDLKITAFPSQWKPLVPVIFEI